MPFEQFWLLGLEPLGEFSDIVQAAQIGDQHHRLGFIKPYQLSGRSAQAVVTA